MAGATVTIYLTRDEVIKAITDAVSRKLPLNGDFHAEVKLRLVKSGFLRRHFDFHDVAVSAVFTRVDGEAST